jgi:hypothetical protein
VVKLCYSPCADAPAARTARLTFDPVFGRVCYPLLRWVGRLQSASTHPHRYGCCFCCPTSNLSVAVILALRRARPTGRRTPLRRQDQPPDRGSPAFRSHHACASPRDSPRTARQARGGAWPRFLGAGQTLTRVPGAQPRQQPRNRRSARRHLLTATTITLAPEVAPAADSAAVVIHSGHMRRLLSTRRGAATRCPPRCDPSGRGQATDMRPRVHPDRGHR